MVTKGAVYCTYYDTHFVLWKPWYTFTCSTPCPAIWLISASHWAMMILGHTTRVPQHFTGPSVQKKVYMSKDAVDHLWSFVDGHHCPYPSVTVSMDVTVALTIH